MSDVICRRIQCLLNFSYVPQVLRGELARAEGELQDRCWTPPALLQQWLQLTHEIENKTYIKKKMAAERQLQHARDAVCRPNHDPSLLRNVVGNEVINGFVKRIEENRSVDDLILGISNRF